MPEKTKIICELESKLEKGTWIILYVLDDEELLQAIYNVLCEKDRVELWCAAEGNEDCDRIRYVSQSELKEILILYHLYEFTDKLIVFSDNSIYPNMMNYVRQGIISENELIQAILYNL